MPFPHPALRGRDAELGAIAGHVGAAAAGRAGVVLVEGPAGIGRSRLLAEAARLAGAAGVAVAAGAADEVEAVVPLGALLGALSGGEPPALDAAGLEALEPAADRPFELLDRLAALLAAAAERRPLLVTLDDVQWADGLTLLALATLTRELAAHPVLWIVSSRPVSASTALILLLDRLRLGGAMVLTLAPLTGGDMAALARDIVGAAPSAGLLELVEGAAGSPAYAVELLRGLAAEGHLELAGGRAKARSGALPVRLHTTVEAHLSSLSAAARQLLDAGSVLGPGFTDDQAAAVLGREPGELRPAADEAAAAGLLVRRDGRLDFRAELVRRAVSESLRASPRRALDREAGGLALSAGAPAQR